MSKRKLLIHEVFEQAKRESGRDTKSGIATYLWTYFEEHLNYTISDRTFIRYYETFIENNRETNINPDRLDKLSKYIGYENFSDFNPTGDFNQAFEKEIENEEVNSSNTFRFFLDGEEVSVPEKIFNIIIKITNNPNFNVPDFMKKNGLGVLEFAFVALLVTGGVFFNNPMTKQKRNSLGFMSQSSETEKSYMYWDGEQFNPTDSSYISPEFEVIAMDKRLLDHQRRITRKDTMTVENSLGRTWYSKYNGDVEFFTADGIDPDTKKELRKSSEYIINKYSGKKNDSIQAE